LPFAFCLLPFAFCLFAFCLLPFAFLLFRKVKRPAFRVKSENKASND